MSTHDPATAYHHTAGSSATAVGQIIALYDTIVRDLRRSAAAVEAGQVEERVNNANHALIVIGELQGVLDFERGGEAARHLSSFYNVARALTTEACTTSSREKILEVAAMFARLRAAWSHVERTISPAEPTERARISSGPQTALLQRVSAPPESSKGSGNEGWQG
ncbi:MAG TPA: flagellar protein FliS [Candidatus Acidoferrum sp.]|nr:flagellar protein FliS [Candidatus Acidoferrum sp.]